VIEPNTVPLDGRGRGAGARSLGAAFRGPSLGNAFWPAAGIILSLALLAPLLAIAHADITEGYRALYDASFGSKFGFSALLVSSIPLILVGLGVALPYRAGLFNIGGEGQLAIGALVAVLIGVKATGLAGVPGSFVVPLLAALVAGGLVGSIAGALKAWRGINEIVTTIMLNFIALFLVQYLVSGPFKEPDLAYAASPPIDQGFALGVFGGDWLLPWGIVIALGVTAFVGWLTAFTRWGWRQRLIGINEPLAARQGISVRRAQLVALALGGALAGLGGAVEAIGNQDRIGLSFSPGWGFDAVAIALLARGKMLAVLPFALFFAVLRNGSNVLQAELNVPGTLVLVLAGAPVMIVAAVIGYRAYRQALAERPDE
jgi:general nucleoside transport system permease protein